MSDLPDVSNGSTGPVAYKALPDQSCSPYKPRKIDNFHPGKHGIVLQPNATLDRRLQGDSSMGATVLVELADFLKPDIIPSLRADKPRATLTDEIVSDARSVLSTLFYDNSDTKKLLNVKEDTIAETMVNVINTVTAILPRKYKAALSMYKPNPSDATRYKVDAALYEEKHVPNHDWPDWTHCRFYIDFKRGDTAYDPWDDRSSKAPENERQSRAGVRAQLIAYAKNVFSYQHRTTLFSLFVIGNSFRAMRWDMSGVIVSKKVNYVNDPRPLLDLVLHLVQLDNTQQGMDPTVTLIKPGMMAFGIMNELAEPNAQDMEYMEPGTENHVPPPAYPPPPKPSPDPSSTPSGKDTVSTSAEGDLAGPEKVPQKRRPRAKRVAATRPQATQDLPQGDANATPAPDDDLPEITEVEGNLGVFKYVRDKFRESLAPGWPRYKLRIRVGNKDRVFLVARPVFETSSMFGRATRGYVAVDAGTRRFVFLKDSWRPFYEGVEQEGVYLEMFAGDDEIIVPAIICHGDVGDQRAYTAQYEELVKKMEADRRREERHTASATVSSSSAKQDVSKKRSHPVEDEVGDVFSDLSPAGEADLSDVKGTLRHHIHYRIAVKDVCLPFEEFRTTEQLIRLMLNCIETHGRVYEKYKLLHRDISAGNVLILPRLMTDVNGTEYVEWRGVLTDWELAKPYLENRAGEKARQPERTGTWQFMPVAYVTSQWNYPVGVPEELESFFHVLLFWAVRFLPHTIGSTVQFVKDYFDTFREDGDDRYLCGAVKDGVMHNANFGSLKLKFLKTNRDQGNPLNKLIQSMLTTFKARYDVLNYEWSIKEKNLEGKPAPSHSNPSGRMPMLPLRQKKIRRVRAVPQSDDSVTAPTQEILRLKERLDSHDWVLSLFEAMQDPDITPTDAWDNTWVVQDQLVGYEPRLILMKNVSTTRETGTRGTDDGQSKRPRTAGSDFAASTAASGQLPGTGSSLSVFTDSGPHRA